MNSDAVSAGRLEPHEIPVPAGPVVFLLDADAATRTSLQSLIDRAGWQIHAFAAGDHFLQKSPTTAPGCVVLRAAPAGDALRILEKIAETRGDLPIVFVAEECDVQSAIRVMKAGALEFLAKPFPDEALFAAIRGAIERSRSVLHAESRLRWIRQAYDALTPRERQVMELVVSGLLNKQVAGELGVAEITVKVHRGNVMRKMNARSFADLVRMAAALPLETGISTNGGHIPWTPCKRTQ
jgi:FixJ family two-component response regulator